MRGRPNPVEALVTLPRLHDPAERRANWRQAIAALGQSLRVSGPPPLDGVGAEQIVRAAQVALETGLCDDLDFLLPGAAAVALYELTAALPAGRERRELGRRVFTRLYQGTAGTFAAVATRMALTTGKPLETPTLRARVALVFDMPILSSVNADALALSLVTRRELLERWVVQPATRSLHSRRLAAQVLEHAAREACTRAQQGDPFFSDLLGRPAIRPSFEQLLADREPLVWRHAAVARGLLAALSPDLRERIDADLDPAQTPSDWRRGAVSLVAGLVAEPITALGLCQQLLQGDLVQRDPGLTAALVWGLPRVIEAEPDAAEQLLDTLTSLQQSDVNEAIADLLRDVQSISFGSRIRTQLADETAASVRRPLEGAAAAARPRLDSSEDASLRGKVRRALAAYEIKGAHLAYELATEAMQQARVLIGRLSELGTDDDDAAEELALLSDLDEAALERSRLGDLLLLGRHPGEAESGVPEIYELYDSLGRWILEREQTLVVSARSTEISLAHQRRLRVLLHLVDLETSQPETENPNLRARIKQTVQLLVQNLGSELDASVERVLCAALARSLDAAARESVHEPCDLLLAVALRVDRPSSIRAVAEASTHPDVRAMFAAYCEFLEVIPPDDPVEAGEGPEAQGEDQLEIARRVVQLSRGFGAAGSYRSEALRKVLLRVGRALELVAGARGLSEMVDPRAAGGDPIHELESSVEALRMLTGGAVRRVLEDDADTDIAVVADVDPISALLERAVSADVPLEGEPFAMAIQELAADLPNAISQRLLLVLARLESLPTSVTSDVYAIPLERRRVALPDWLMPRRTIGAFYVVRALGTGGVSSVFVARRLEERHDPNAEAFALKVPQFDPTMARSLSEQEFLQMFREEAGALLSLPQHPNLARFVTFDLAARPKPILVMELIRGASLDRLVRSRSLTTSGAFAYLDGMLAGLSAMHGAGIGHLDLKPSNIILRDSEIPVLVDFGLSGRHLRPGCGTLEYCAPEILGVVPAGYTPPPMATDVYAFACLAFEVLTADLLLDAEDEMSLIALQLGHDGWPERLRAFAQQPGCAAFAEVLAACLRKDPRARPSADQVRQNLAALRDLYVDQPWPLGREATDPPRTAELSA
ncbi:MAG TPA: serine/threonine-protein kinase [Polyangiaceae bacterium]|nr:serine/threonine-protein kinase [Polyangiaceae bacterium]